MEKLVLACSIWLKHGGTWRRSSESDGRRKTHLERACRRCGRGLVPNISVLVAIRLLRQSPVGARKMAPFRTAGRFAIRAARASQSAASFRYLSDEFMCRTTYSTTAMNDPLLRSNVRADAMKINLMDALRASVKGEKAPRERRKPARGHHRAAKKSGRSNARHRKAS